MRASGGNRLFVSEHSYSVKSATHKSRRQFRVITSFINRPDFVVSHTPSAIASHAIFTSRLKQNPSRVDKSLTQLTYWPPRPLCAVLRAPPHPKQPDAQFYQAVRCPPPRAQRASICPAQAGRS